MLLTDYRPYQINNYFSSNQPRALIKCIISDWDCWANALQIVNSATQRTVCHSPALLRCCLSCSMLLLVQRSNQTIEAAHTSITSVNRVVGHKIVQTKPNQVITGQTHVVANKRPSLNHGISYVVGAPSPEPYLQRGSPCHNPSSVNLTWSNMLPIQKYLHSPCSIFPYFQHNIQTYLDNPYCYLPCLNCNSIS